MSITILTTLHENLEALTTLPPAYLRALSIFLGYFATIFLCIYLIFAWSILLPLPAKPTTSTSPPTKATTTTIKVKITLFSLFSATALALTWFHMIRYLRLSYVLHHHHQHNQGTTTTTTPPPPVILLIAQWLRSARLFEDAYRIVVDGPVRWWWSQQIFLGCFAWGGWVAGGAHGAGGAGGKRRWVVQVAYMLFAQLVSLSVAVGLWCVDVLVEEERERRRKARGVGGGKKEEKEGKEVQEKEGAVARLVGHILPPVLLVGNYVATVLLPVYLPPPTSSTNSNSSTSTSTSPSSSTSTFLLLLLTTHVSLFIPFLLPRPKSTHTLLLLSLTGGILCHARAWLLLPPGTTWAQAMAGVWGVHPAVSSICWDVVMVGVGGVLWAGVGGRKDEGWSVWRAVGQGVGALVGGAGTVAAAFLWGEEV